jgi:predicted ABC-type ATPase
VVLAGPNGAGKSTLANRLVVRALQVPEFIDAEMLARTLPHSPAGAPTAGRAVLRRLNQLSAQRESFGCETTLASRSLAWRIRKLIADGYECHLVFLWLASVDTAVARVADRVRAGGHTVPEETVRHRYRSGLANFFSLYRALTNDLANVRQFDR